MHVSFMQMRAPSMTISFDSLHAAHADTVLLRARATGLDLKGQVLPVRVLASPEPVTATQCAEHVRTEHGGHQRQLAEHVGQRDGRPEQDGEQGFLFLGSPWLAGLAGMRQHGICISDIARHDSTRDFVLLAEQRHAETQLKERLETLTLELKVRAVRVIRSPSCLGDHRLL